MNKSLFIFKENQVVGELIFDSKQDSISLKYSSEWIQNGFPLSPHLPFNKNLNSSTITSASTITIKRFLENLFPEGQNFNDLLEEFRISRTHTFRILEILGSETTGAFSFGDETFRKKETSFRLVQPSELITKLDEKEHRPLFIWDGRPRLSLAGVQDKLPILILPDGRMGLGEGDLASTHILKFEKQKKTIPFLVLNEFFCMRLAKKLRLPVANVNLLKLGNHWTLIIERFDRRWRGESKKVKRLHIIDGCQALDLSSSYKYERNFGVGREVSHIRDGVTLKALFDFCNQCRVPANAILNTINWLIFNLCISNSDAHGKNISYFVNEKGITLAPFYDLLNTHIYPEIEQDLVMSIGDEFVLSEIKGFQLSQLCEEIGISKRILSNEIKKITTRILNSIDEVDFPEILTPVEIDFISTLKKNIIERTQHFMKCAPEIPRI